MTQDMKRLLMMGLKYCKHYEINHNKETRTYTLKVWLNEWEFITFTHLPDINDTVIVTYYEQPKSYFCPTPRVLKLDKICGKKNRERNKHYCVMSIDKAFEIIQSLEMYASPSFKLSKYPYAPENLI